MSPSAQDIGAPAKPWKGKIRPLLIIAIAVWSVAVGAGLSILWAYENRPGVSAKSLAQWPAESKVQLDPTRPTLIMLVHPKCPCSRASVGELAKLMARTDGQLSAYVLFLKPTGVADDWEKSDLWQSAANIPGVTVTTDVDGAEAARFQAATSGQTLLFDTAGNLLFKGGITAARGHHGDNAGSETIFALVNKQATETDETSVFGCPLFDPNSDCRKPDHGSNKP